jgi:hypothetical protein
MPACSITTVRSLDGLLDESRPLLMLTYLSELSMGYTDATGHVTQMGKLLDLNIE